MTTPPPDPPSDDRLDDRDPRVAAWLAVEPLDEVTRSRLVRRAVAEADAAEAGPKPTRPKPVRGRPVRLLVAAAAAALLVGVVVALAVLLPRDDSTPTAVDRPRRETPTDLSDPTDRAPELDQERLADPGTPMADASSALPALGDLGDVSTEDRLRRAVRPRLDQALGDPATVAACAVDVARGSGVPVAAGSGRVGEEPAIVVVLRRDDGATLAVAVTGVATAGSCEAPVRAVVEGSATPGGG